MVGNPREKKEGSMKKKMGKTKGKLLGYFLVTRFHLKSHREKKI